MSFHHQKYNLGADNKVLLESMQLSINILILHTPDINVGLLKNTASYQILRSSSGGNAHTDFAMTVLIQYIVQHGNEISTLLPSEKKNGKQLVTTQRRTLCVHTLNPNIHKSFRPD